MSLQAIPVAISALGRDQQLRDAIARSPGAVAMLRRHWLQEDKYLSQMELIDPLFSGALHALLIPEIASDRMPVLDVMVAAAGDAQTIASAAIEHARNALGQASEDDWMNIHTHADLIYLSVSIPALHRALLSQKSLVDLVTDLLHTLGGQRGNRHKEICFIPTFLILLELFHSSSSLQWIIRAVDAGALENTLRLGVQLQRKRTDAPLDLSAAFFKILSQTLVYRSFLRSLVKAMKKIERARIGPDDAAILWAPWMSFKKDAERRLQFKAVFGQKIQSDLFSRKCENPEVRTHSTYSTFLTNVPSSA
jgi:hypothetical protein